MCGSSAGQSTIAVEGDVDDTPDVQDSRPGLSRLWAIESESGSPCLPVSLESA